MKVTAMNRYESIPKRSFRNAIIRCLEEQYKILGSHKVLQMVADDIVRLTSHKIESVSRYIRNYKNVKLLIEKDFNFMEMVRITGMGRSTVLQYRDRIYQYHPNLNPEEKNIKQSATKRNSKPGGKSGEK